MSPNQNLVTEKEEQRFHDLNAKKDRTPEETTELEGLKTNYANTAKDRIGKLSGEKKAAIAEKEEAIRLKEETEQKNKDLQAKLDASAPAETIVGDESETVEVAGKKYYTDAALSAQMKSGKITEAAAVNYQTERNKKELVVAVRTDIKKEDQADKDVNDRLVDAKGIIKLYPHFNTKHPDHNPNDPLYKMTIELFNDGFGLKPDGLSKSVKRAKQILGIKDTPVDRSSELSVEDGGAPADKGDKGKGKEVTLSENEEEAAVAMFCRGDVPNPKTGRPYTRDEAIATAKVAKQGRRRA